MHTRDSRESRNRREHSGENNALNERRLLRSDHKQDEFDTPSRRGTKGLVLPIRGEKPKVGVSEVGLQIKKIGGLLRLCIMI